MGYAMHGKVSAQGRTETDRQAVQTTDEIKESEKMTLWDDFAKKAGETARSFGARAKEVAETTKLNGQIAVKRTETEKLYGEIGKIFFAVRAGKVQDGEELEALCLKAEALEKEIEEIQAQIDVIRQVRRCANCGEVSPISARFCGACGTKFEEKPAPVESVIVPETPKIENVQAEDGVEISWPQAQGETGEEKKNEE